jgi:hypothetical protein
MPIILGGHQTPNSAEVHVSIQGIQVLPRSVPESVPKVILRAQARAQELTGPEDEECETFLARFLVRFSDVENEQGERP